MAGGTEARFNLLQKGLNSYTSLGFCAWYIIVYSIPSYNINSTYIKKIKALFQAKKGFKTARLRGTGALPQSGLEVDLTGSANKGVTLAEESQQQHSQEVAKHS